MLRLEGISFDYDGAPVLENVGFHVKPGAFEGLIGPSGCGKTTLIRLIAGLDVPTRGTLEREYRRLGLVCQDDTLIEPISVLRNLTYVCPDAGRARHCLELVGLGDLAPEQKAGTLSKGMKKRVEIARALSIQPDFLVMDEPFSGLDHVAKYALIAQLKQFVEPGETTLLYVTHDLSEAMVLCDNLTVFSGRPARVLRRFEDIRQEDPEDLRHEIIGLLGR